ncbi:hypothetical protein M0R45_015116 [Rubus argutus]|uniref:Uncharacterized protein n=1 Tax=Rubus argutus TaxID=59490 RepID=A0AAW1XPL4_RUBAR
MSVRLRKMDISNYEKLGTDIQNLNSLEELSIDDCEGLTSFPPNLTSLTIRKMKHCKSLLESQGLHRLTSLRRLSIIGEDDRGLVSFPAAQKGNKNDMMLQLPKSLVYIYINGFPNLKKLSNDFQFLTSLEILDIDNCPKLASIPEESLPLSLEYFYITKCPLLEERCKVRYWPKITHVSFVVIDGKLIYK